MRYFDFRQARERLEAGKPVYAEYFSKATGEQVKCRVVRINRGPFGPQLVDINGNVSEHIGADRVVLSDG